MILTARVIRTVEDYREVSRQERDQTGLIPDEVKLNPLMRGLQVRPEDLKTFRLAGREHLAGVQVAATNLQAYGRLREVIHG